MDGAAETSASDAAASAAPRLTGEDVAASLALAADAEDPRNAAVAALLDALAAARPAIAERLTSDPLGGRAAAKRSSAPGQQPDGASPTAC